MTCVQTVYVRGHPREQKQRTGVMRQGRRENQDEMNYEDRCCGRFHWEKPKELSTEAPGMGAVINRPLAPVGWGSPLGALPSLHFWAVLLLLPMESSQVVSCGIGEALGRKQRDVQQSANVKWVWACTWLPATAAAEMRGGSKDVHHHQRGCHTGLMWFLPKINWNV